MQTTPLNSNLVNGGLQEMVEHLISTSEFTLYMHFTCTKLAKTPSGLFTV